jgi:DNA-3-methyladenine glycosylase
MTDSPQRERFRVPDRGFFSSGVLDLAPRLLGCLLVHRTDAGIISGIITETEAYHESEPSCHAFGGETRRNRPMFGHGGLAYVYRIYGLHTCFNVTSGEEGSGEAVLVRSLEPGEGLELMMENRGRTDPQVLCNGPGNLCRALGIDISMNGADLTKGPLQVLVPAGGQSLPCRRTARIGVRKAADLDWRFVAEPVEHLSSARVSESDV